MSRYRNTSIFMYRRTIRKWIVVIDGEEFPFNRKKHAFMSAAVAKSLGFDTKLIEDTTLRFRSPAAVEFHEENFQIDISNQIP